MPEQQSYYIVIPGVVYGNKALDHFAKLLFGEIAAKCNRRGYCWATNETLGDIMGCSVRTLQRGLTALKSCGHIRIEVIRNDSGTHRRIWLAEASENDQSEAMPPVSTEVPKADTPPANNGVLGGDAGGAHNTLINSEYSKTNILKGTRASEHEGVEWPWETETFWEAWVQWREYKLKEHRFRYKLKGSEQAALNMLRDLAGDSEANAHAIIRQSMANGWKGFFHLKTSEHEGNRGTTAGGNGQANAGHNNRFDALRNWGGTGSTKSH